MPIPNYQTFMRPVLKHLADGNEHQLSKLIQVICDDFDLTPQQRSLKIPSGKSTYVYGRISWAKTYLVQAELLTQPKRGYCVITERGLDALSSTATINNHYLKQFPEFIAFQKRTNSLSLTKSEGNGTDTKGLVQESSLENEQTPHELLENTFNTINSTLAGDILDAHLYETRAKHRLSFLKP